MNALLLLTMTLGAAPADDWKQLPSLPDTEGYAGAFAGVADGHLLVAGGANFPDKKPWENGTKVWYDTVRAMDLLSRRWKPAGRLPRPLGYGVSVTHRDTVICAGGSDATRHYADVFRLAWKEDKLETTALPPLPVPVANGCGTLIGDRLYVFGGQSSPTADTALDTLYELDLAATTPAWRELEPCPAGGRIFPVAAAVGDDLYVMSGASLSKGADGKVVRRYLTDVWRFRDSDGWQRMADLPRPVLGAPSPAPTDDNGFLVLGGDDGSQIGITPPQGHKGFSKAILRYDVAANTWQGAGELKAARVVTPCVEWDNMWVVPTGEALPGIRSADVWGMKR